MSAARQSWRTPVVALTGLIGACAVCCAGPLLAVLGGIGTAGLIGAFWLPALLLVAVLAGVGVAFELRRRRRAAACQPAQVGPVDLDTPTMINHDH